MTNKRPGSSSESTSMKRLSYVIGTQLTKRSLSISISQTVMDSPGCGGFAQSPFQGGATRRLVLKRNRHCSG
jgi:hypothetical protein